MGVEISVSTDDLPQVLRMIREAGEDMDVAIKVTGPQRQQPDASAPADPDTPGPHGLGPADAVGASGSSSVIGTAAMDKLTKMASPHDRARLVSFIEQQITEHDAVVDPGPDHLKYVRLHLPTSRGAYCYPTTRGFIDFRLRPEDHKGCQHTIIRGGDNHGAPFSLRLRLDSDSAMTEALALARTAVSRFQAKV